MPRPKRAERRAWPTTRIQLFDEWFAEARRREPNDPEAMALATADADGRPSVRMVLLKGHDARGFVFYTNLDSRKGGELAANPRAALLFHWKSLRRQVRIEGPVEPVTDSRGRRLFRDPLARFAARRLGVGPVAAARRAARPSRRATRSCADRFEGSDGAAPAALVRLPADRPSGSNSGPTGRTGCTSAGCSPATADGWTEGLLYP